MSIDTSFTLQPTDPTAPQAFDAPQPAEPTTTPKPAPAIQHTEGGLPAIPLLIITSNTAAAGLSAAAIAAGPLAAAGIAAGTLAAAAAMSAASRKKKTKTTTRRAPVKPAPKKANAAAARKSVPAARTRSTGSGGSRTGSTSRPSSGRTGGLGAAKKATPSAKGASTAQKPGATRKPGAGTGTPTNKPQSRTGQIKALRAAKKAEGKTRKQQREQATQTRRALKDGRRGEKAALTNLKKQTRTDPKNNPAAVGTRKAGKTGPGASLTKFAAKKAAGARTRARTSKDQAALSRGQRIKQARRNTKARAVMARKVLGAKARYGTKAAAAALLTTPAGLIGCLTTPLGRKLGWKWLMNPGRRLYQRLTRRAREQRTALIQNAKDAHTTETSSTEDAAPPTPIADTVPRGPRYTTQTTLGEVMADLKFLFQESAAEMEEAAASYEPGGMMHVYQTIQGMPAGIQSWASTFRILAEKSDDSFPLEKEVGEALGEVFNLLQKAAEAAEDVQRIFEEKHEHDLERLHAPRVSLEAEKAWDAAANEDYL